MNEANLHKTSALRSWAMNLILLIASLILVAIAGELYFRYAYVKSDGFSLSLAAKKWMDMHWKPINELGYRDKDYTLDVMVNKKRVYVIGDSIVAGHGIENVEDRFTNVLEKMLGPDYLVANVAINGWSTYEEHQALFSYPVKPHFVVLTYYMNDIERACAISGNMRPPSAMHAKNSFKLVTDNSHMANFMYWRFFSLTQIGNAYKQYIEGCINTQHVMAQHLFEIAQFANTVRSMGAGLAVVIVPNLQDMQMSKPLTDQVRGLLEAKGVKVIDMSEKLAGRPGNQLVVNAYDAHPNVQVHKEIAQSLLPIVKESLP